MPSIRARRRADDSAVTATPSTRTSPADGLIDYPADPGCHSINDDDESDLTQGDIRSRLLLLFDTSGSMNWNVCNPTFTGGDGSAQCGGADVSCMQRQLGR